MLYAIIQSLYCHLRRKDNIFPLTIFANEILNIFGKRCTDFEMGLFLFAVLVEWKNVIYVVNKCGDSYGAESHWRRWSKILLMFFDKKVMVIQQETIKLWKVLLLCHLVLFAIYTIKEIIEKEKSSLSSKSDQSECFNFDDSL